MKSKPKTKKSKYCRWCGVKTNIKLCLSPETPILEFIEDKIDELGRDGVWGEDNIVNQDLDPNTEAELLIYDGILSNVTLKYLCEKCTIEDDILYLKYYGEEDEGDG